MTAHFENLILDFSKIQIKANQDGLIPGYDVLITQIPTKLFNLFSSRLLQSILNSSKGVSNSKELNENLCDYAAGLFENAAADCGFRTGLGIINSDEFQSILGFPDRHSKETLYGLFAVAVSWGWGDFEIIELIPYKRMVLRAYDYYESDIKYTYKPQKGFAYMITGICRAFMDIVYNSPTYKLGGFKCEQTKGIELGDEYGEFITTRMKEEA